MTQETQSILFGIMSGIATAALLFVVNRLIQNTFVPWYRTAVYKGLNVSGQWFSQSIISQKIVIELHQNCEVLKGKATYVTEDNLDIVDTIRTFDVNGFINNRFVVLNLTHTDPSRLGLVSFLLEVAGDGTVLRGKSTAYSPSDSQIGASSFEFFRDENRAKGRREKALELLKHSSSLRRLKGKQFIFTLPGDVERELEEAEEKADEDATMEDDGDKNANK